MFTKGHGEYSGRLMLQDFNKIRFEAARPADSREPPALYKGISEHENVALRRQDEYYWESSV